jgi:transposase
MSCAGAQPTAAAAQRIKRGRRRLAPQRANLFHYRREEFLEHYHQRSAVESAFSMMKAKFGSSVRSKSEQGQVNEVLCKVLAHNVCVVIRAMHELGIEPGF